MQLDPFFAPEGKKERKLRSKGETDTDSNCAVAGALLGAYCGLSAMCNNKITKENLRIFIKANPNKGDVPRPNEYHNIKLFDIAKKLTSMYLKNKVSPKNIKKRR